MSSAAKEVTRVLSDELEKFEADNLCLRMAKVKKMGGQSGRRSEFTEWYDVPKVSTVIDGLSLPNFNENTRLSVPHRVNTYASVPFRLTNTDTLDSSELSDELSSALQALDNRVNRSVANAVSIQGSQYVSSTTALDGYDNVSSVETRFLQEDINQTSKKSLILNGADYNNMAGNLAARQTLTKQGIAQNAYEKAAVAEIAGFDAFKTSFTPVKAGAALASTTVTGAQSYIPQGSTIDANGDPTNVDNRSMNLVVGTTAGVVAGDKFTIAGVNAVSMQNKNDSGNLRTFTVLSVTDGTNMVISPAIVPVTSTPTTTATQAQADYANCSAVAAGGAALTFINYDTATTNLFWENDSICINVAPVLGSENDLGGMVLMNATTDLGLNVVVAKQGAIGDLSTQWRVTTFFGVTVRDPLRCGVLAGSQTP